LTNGDLMVALVVPVNNGTDLDVYAPNGWTSFGSPLAIWDGVYYSKMRMYWKRAYNESGSYKFEHTNAMFRQCGAIVAYSGVLERGNPLDALAQNNGTGATSTASSVTTTAANDLLLVAGNSHDINGGSPPSGFVERVDNLHFWHDKVDAGAAGATGSFNFTNTGVASRPWQAWTAAFKQATGATPITPPAFRSIATTAYASRSSPSTVSKPTGTATDDILLLGIFTGTGGAHGDVTTPSGFTKIGTTIAMTDTGFYGRLQLFWKRATGSEPSSYSITHDLGATRSTEVALVAYSGCVTSGDPVDAVSSNVNITPPSGTSMATMASVTPTQEQDLLIWFGNNWDASGGLVWPYLVFTWGAGAAKQLTERYGHLLYVADALVGLEATGIRQQNQASANPWAVYSVLLKGAG
jgi:hypothetical protein